MDVLFQQLSLPDLWQQEAVRALRDGEDVVVDAPTGAGKTRIFELFVEKAKLASQNRQAIYTVPTRALANDKWAEWKEKGWNVGIATGDLALNTSAPIVVATLETQRERFLVGEGPALLVVDEYQMIADPHRGLHYELVLTLAPQKTRLLLLSGSVGNPERVVEWLKRQERPAKLIATRERPVPLDDVHLLGLPHQAPKSFKGFWPRLAAETLLADMAPLLIFVPHRKGAENVARQIAEALPLHDPLELTPPQRPLAGKELQKMLAKRVCYHHSGLRYELRAGLLEPLARAGQLRVIVATMGLAAGINFSVRSVFVAESTYHDGPFVHALQSDELLQMFGRAGRRGKDTAGYVIHGDKNPRLTDGRACSLKRANEIDWPTLLRIMQQAVAAGRSPFDAAARFCERLFSLQPILLGIESERHRIAKQSTASEPPAPQDNAFGLGRTRREVLNRQGEWEPFDRRRFGQVPLKETFIHQKENWVSSTLDFSMIAGQTRLGQVKRREVDGDRFLVKEVVLATRSEDSQPWRVTKSVAKQLPKPFPKTFRDPDGHTRTRLCDLLAEIANGGVVGSARRENDHLLADIDYRDQLVEAYQDQSDHWLIEPPQRTTELERETAIISTASSASLEPTRDSPVHAWRSLGLIEADGTPTRRGIIFSFFYHGEGLAIAAALESPHYPIEDIVWHLANLRSGYRFRDFEGEDGERLGMVCRQTYGSVSHAGYLKIGVPEQFGGGAAEAVRMLLESGKAIAQAGDELGRGDVERVLNEWMSLLRQIAHAPDHDWDRWKALKVEAERQLTAASKRVKPFATVESTLTLSQRQPYEKQRLRYSDFRRSTF